MSEESLVYLDYAATTPLDSRVLEAMTPYFSQVFGNPSSVHRYGQRAEAAVEASRRRMASVLNCAPSELIFTGCGSESDNLALRGAALAARAERNANHILISPVEHDAVLKTADSLSQRDGFEVELLPVDSYGRVAPQDLDAAIRPDTAVVSIMYANNEIGTVNPIQSLAEICRKQQILFHTDAVQAAGSLTVDVQDLAIDLMSLGAHKFYGPKGVGALYIRNGVALVPTLTGGSQERGLRAGTHNVPLIVGMAAALALTESERAEHSLHYQRHRDAIIDGVLAMIPQAQLTGHPTERLPNHASFIFDGVDGNALLAALDLAGFACSSGSACKTGDPEPSSVLTAIGFTPDQALGSLRVTVGRPTTDAQIASFLAALPQIVERVASLETSRQ
ncbi:MAG: cysteine desulfurase family protein [Anaerolineales bacterium]